MRALREERGPRSILGFSDAGCRMVQRTRRKRSQTRKNLHRARAVGAFPARGALRSSVYPSSAAMSFSGVVVGAMPYCSTKKARMSGDTNAGRVGPRRMSLIPR